MPGEREGMSSLYEKLQARYFSQPKYVIVYDMPYLSLFAMYDFQDYGSIGHCLVHKPMPIYTVVTTLSRRELHSRRERKIAGLYLPGTTLIGASVPITAARSVPLSPISLVALNKHRPTRA